MQLIKSYVGLKRIVHNALHLGKDAPPVSHADTWYSEPPYASGSGRVGIRKRPWPGMGQSAEDSDDDVAMVRGKISLTCLITLLPFRDPVTSEKCPHSVEKDAILSIVP